LITACQISPGVPCKPMLAKPTKGIQVIFNRFEDKKFTCEFKYDGLRGQLHYKDGEVMIYSRNLENMTEKYPDIIKLLKENIDTEKVTDFIADSEIVAFDTNTKRILPFQILMTRSKKNVTVQNVKVTVCLFVFDLIYLNGKSLLDEPLRLRRDLMWNHLPKVEGKLDFVSAKDTEDTEEIQTFLEESVKRKNIR
jgi:DNA ligase-1